MAGGFATGVVLPTVVTAVVSTGLAVAVNIATDDDRTSAVAWLVVAALTAVTALLSLWVRRAAAPDPPPASPVRQRVDASAVAGSVTQIGRACRVVVRRTRG